MEQTETLVQAGSAVEKTVELIGGKWKGLILYHLIAGEARFNQLRRLIPGVTQRMLALQLRDLEKDGLITREEYKMTPRRVGYRLTELGRSLTPVILLMKTWGEQYSASIAK
ncbi:winged helix-turn-helix transcriptional regulator [Cohnella fermenti]|uniref:Helix-turn-helix transcriptional regulator n=1 Tax=Cohnella fermenti TaxID=2565925 RepID=A0A4V6RXN2_9BACL|nr:helix-turn-helix domain-containing protein [Cohnella fermenti]THF81698.1 helix-turn-helix transcriptional regulator [Cohnella fermenti]